MLPEMTTDRSRSGFGQYCIISPTNGSGSRFSGSCLDRGFANLHIFLSPNSRENNPYSDSDTRIIPDIVAHLTVSRIQISKVKVYPDFEQFSRSSLY